MARDPTIFDLLADDGLPRPVQQPGIDPLAQDVLDPADPGQPLSGAMIETAMGRIDTSLLASMAGPLPQPPRGRRILVYDTEVFPNLVLHVFWDGERTTIIHHQCWDRLPALVGSEVVLAGFNNAAYDDPILRFILSHPRASVADIHRLSTEIVAGRTPAGLRWGAAPWAASIDVRQLLNGHGSLKEWECRIGFPVVLESPLPFDRPVPSAQVPPIIEYCCNDVAATGELLRRNWDLVTMRSVLQGIQGQSDAIYATTEAGIAESTMSELLRRRTGISRQDLKARAAANPDNRPGRRWLAELVSSRVSFTTPPFQAVLEAVQGGALEVGERGIGRLDIPGVPADGWALGGIRCQIGTGGLHSMDGPGTWQADDGVAIIDLDVTSYYPSLILNEGWYPRHYGPTFLDALRGMRDRRVAAKQAGDKRTATALKIVINSIYGKLNDVHSALRSVPDSIRVTLNGQLLLLMLVETLVQAGAEVLSANTDGVTALVPRTILTTAIRPAVAAWEETTGLDLEWTAYRSLFRRDINNYLAVTESGDLKTKGAFGEGIKDHGQVVREAAIRWLQDGVDPAVTVASTRQVQDFLFHQRARGDATLVLGDQEVGRVARWYIAFGGEALCRRSRNDGSLTTIPHGHHARLAMDIRGWSVESMPWLDQGAYTAQAWRLIQSVGGPAKAR